MNASPRTSARRLQPALLFLGLVLFIVAAWFVATPRRPITAAQVAANLNRVASLPRDLGDGLRMDRIVASGNDVIVTLTVVDIPPPPYPPETIEAFKQAAQADVCREFNKDPRAKAALAKAGIAMVREFRNGSGATIFSHRVTADLC